MRTLPALWSRAVERFGPAPLFGTRGDGGWRWTRYRDVGADVARCRGGLSARGIGRGDRVALFCDNRIEWAVTAHAAWSLGATLVPFGESLGSRDCQRILGETRPDLVVCGRRDTFERAAALAGELPRVGVGLPAADEASFARLLSAAPAEPATVEPGDTAAVLYTAGTTGDPKGVVLQHESLCAAIDAVCSALPLGSDDRSVSFLPWEHAFGLTCELGALVQLGVSMAIAGDAAKLLEEIAEVQPTVLVTVPRLWTRLYERVMADMAARPPVIRKAFEAALDLKRRERGGGLSIADRLLLKAADRTVLAQVRRALGGRLRWAFTGGAPLPQEIGGFVAGLGVPLYEGYGLTEAAGPVAANTPSSSRHGSVGRPLRGVRVTIEPREGADGEIVVAGPTLASGYFAAAENGERAFTSEGLRTGDTGYLDRDGYLYVTGCVGERYKLQNGLWVTPGVVEEAARLSPYIADVVVWGEGQPHNVALVAVDVDALSKWASERRLAFGSTAEMLASERVRSFILAEIGERTASLRPHERVRQAALVAGAFTLESGLIAPTLKLRRRAVLDRYGEALAALYD
jgi:long-chain acyl-CoA synthetase